MLREAIFTAFIIVDVAHTVRDKRRKHIASKLQSMASQIMLFCRACPVDHEFVLLFWCDASAESLMACHGREGTAGVPSGARCAAESCG